MTPRYDLPIAHLPWPVPKAGYHWVHARGQEGDLLLPIEVDGSVEMTDPVRNEPALYRVFADTQLTKKGFKEFAETYGTLGVKIDAHGFFANRPFEPTELSFIGSAPIVAGIKPGDQELLDEEIERSPNGIVARAVKEAAVRIESHNRRYADPYKVWESQLERMKTAVDLFVLVEAEKATPTQEASLRAIANTALAGPDLRLELSNTRAHTESMPDGDLALHIRPFSLLALMWVQFVLAATESRDHRKCEGCGKWFEISADHGHGKQDYCRPACKARAYRKRKQQAILMASNGSSVAEIAKSLGSTVATVKGWIGGVKKATKGQHTGSGGT